MAKGGGGDAHQRAILAAKNRAKKQENSGTISNKGTLPSNPIDLIALRLPEKTIVPSPRERIFAFLENGIVLAVLGIIGGLAGLVIDGRYFVILSAPILLGLHRSSALNGASRRAKILINSCLFAAALWVLWRLGVQLNQTHEHVPSAREIATEVSKTIEGNQEGGSRRKHLESIDEFIAQKDENGLKDLFDFPNLLFFNLKFAKIKEFPELSSKEEAEAVKQYFQGGQALLDISMRM